jgi:outer membrane receptor protein involved in Fe transport
VVKASIGGNPNLQPVNSESWDTGVVFEPEFVPGLRLAFDWYRIQQRDRITNLSTQAIVNNESEFPGRVTRGTPTAPFDVGKIVSVDASALNLTKAVTNGYDISLGYRESTRFGTFDLSALGTVIQHFRTQNTVNAPFVDIADQVADFGPLKEKANATLSWELRGWTARWAATYYGSYPQIAPPFTRSTSTLLAQNSAGIPSQIYHNILLAYGIPSHAKQGDSNSRESSSWTGSAFSGVNVQMGIKNVFNKTPPFDANFAPYYYSPFGDPLLRTFWVSLSKDF